MSNDASDGNTEHLAHDIHALKSKEPDELKRVIRSYTNAVTVLPDEIDVESVVTVAGGAGGNRTHVQEYVT